MSIEDIEQEIKKITASKIVTENTTGITTAAYLPALVLACSEYGDKTIHIVNKEAAQTMFYKLLATYSASQTIEHAETIIAETSIAAATDVRLQYNKVYYSLIVQVKNNGGACIYEINYIMRRE